MHRAFDIADPKAPAAVAPPLHVAAHKGDVPSEAGDGDKGLNETGRLDIAFTRRGPETVLTRAFQRGALRLRVPGREAGEPPCAVLINTGGGVVGGDRLDQALSWGAGTRATVTSQAAEKVYRALAGREAARIETRLDIAEGARAEWLPQETILFDGCNLRRETRVLLAENVTFLGVEALILGRAAMAEQVRQGRVRDSLRIWRAGKLIYADALSLEGDIAALMDRAAIGNGARAMAVIVHAAPDAAGLLDPLRAVLASARGTAAASHWQGLLAARLLAPDGESLRHDIALALGVLRGGRPLPRVWRC